MRFQPKSVLEPGMLNSKFISVCKLYFAVEKKLFVRQEQFSFIHSGTIFGFVGVATKKLQRTLLNNYVYSEAIVIVITNST